MYFCVFNPVLLRDNLSCIHAYIHSYAAQTDLLANTLYACTRTHSFCRACWQIHMHTLTHRRIPVRKRSVWECYVYVYVKRLGRTSGCVYASVVVCVSVCLYAYGYEDTLYIYVFILLYVSSYHYMCRHTTTYVAWGEWCEVLVEVEPPCLLSPLQHTLCHSTLRVGPLFSTCNNSCPLCGGGCLCVYCRCMMA